MPIPEPVTAIDLHACGEPGRVITGGVPDVPGSTMFEKKEYLERNMDWLRKLMLQEPRGYPALCCNVILPPTRADADVGFVIMEQTEYPPMSGSNIICVVTALIESGRVRVQEPVTELVLEAPAGLVPVQAEVTDGKVTRVTFDNVPSFATHLDVELDVPTLGLVHVDVAYGGMFFVIADAASVGVSLVPESGRELVRVGELLRHAAREQLPVRHPENPQIDGVTISQLSGPSQVSGASYRNAVIVSAGALDPSRPEKASGSLDRSPCGTGTCAKMAALYAKGELGLHEDFVHESVLGTNFTGRLIEETRVGTVKAVRPRLSGRAWITGMAEYVLDPTDPFPTGFRVGDIWGT